MASRKRLILSITVVFLVFWGGVAGYLVIDPTIPLFRAMYMVAITLSTVGFRDDIVTTNPRVQAWTMLIIVFGVIATMVVITSLVGLIVQGEVGRLFGSRKLESKIKSMDNHTIICGLGRVGTMLARHLTDRHVPVVIIEKKPEQCRLAEELRLLYIQGDATDEDALRKAGIERAKNLVAVLRSDAENVFITLTARQMRPNLFIVARAELSSAEPKLRHAGADRVISPQAIGAERIVNILTHPLLVDFVDVVAKGMEFEMDAVVVASDSPIAGQTLREADIRATADVMVVAIRRPDGTIRFNPGANERIMADDTLITIGPSGAAARLSNLQIIRPATTQNRPQS